jgi:hypothetical protein
MKLSAKAAAILEAAQRHETPSADVRARVWEQTQLRAAAGDLGPALPETAVTSSVVTTKLVGWIAAAALGGGAVVAGVVMLDREPTPAVSVASDELVELDSVPDEEVAEPEPTAETLVLPEPQIEPELEIEIDTSVAEATAPKRRAASKLASTPGSESRQDAKNPFNEEVELMGRARAALGGGDASRALALLEEHAKRFPKGALGPERDVSRIMALCALGRVEQAKKHATTFLRRHPSSALADRVRRTCVGDDLR